MLALRAEAAESPRGASPSLVYVSDDQPGIRRLRHGEGFRYLDAKGGALKDKVVLERIRKLAIPPAWRDVWISPDANGHIQATGRDVRGRKQYRYHAGWRELRDRTKYDHVIAFAEALPEIRRRVAADMARQGICREKVCATIVGLLDKTLVRVGNDEYARTNGSYGLTTLESDHLEVRGEEVRFRFTGKSGRVWSLSMRHRRIARIMRTFQDLPGQRLFQYADGEEIREVTSSDVNAYLREIAGPDVSAKDFRTWAGTVIAAIELAAAGPFASATEAKRKIRQAVINTAERLGNTPTICRKCYVHPRVIECYMSGRLPDFTGNERDAIPRDLSRDERRVLAMLSGGKLAS